jgi:hypothetical protein
MTAESKALLTKSRLETARRCQRLHRLKYEQGYSAIVELGGRRFGTLFHGALEAWWLAKQAGFADDECLLNALNALTGETDQYELAKAHVLMTAYHLRWAGEPFEVLGVETQFVAPLVNPTTGAPSRTWELAGKLDVIARDLRTGRIVFIEHKTSGEDITPGSPYWRRLRMDTQVSVYFEGAHSLGYDAEACIYDVIGKPTIRPQGVPIVEDGAKVVLDANGARVRTKDGKKWRETADSAAGYVLQTRPETPVEYMARLTEAVSAEPDRYLQRGEIVRLESEMSEAMQDVWDTGKQIQEAKVAGRAPRNPSACVAYGHACDFFEVCSGAAAIDDPALFTRNDNVHPELVIEEAADAQTT